MQFASTVFRKKTSVEKALNPSRKRLSRLNLRSNGRK